MIDWRPFLTTTVAEPTGVRSPVIGATLINDNIASTTYAVCFSLLFHSLSLSPDIFNSMVVVLCPQQTLKRFFIIFSEAVVSLDDVCACN